MEDEALLLAEEVIREYSLITRKLLDNTISIGKEIAQRNLGMLLVYHSITIANAKSLVGEIQEIHKKSLMTNRETSCDFNMLRLFSIGETQHSYLLAYFLNPNEAHGQGHLFLNIFLDLLEIDRRHDSENWIITAEKGRIDVLLKRVHPHSVVVIENKSNYAKDQDHQLYRYWHQEIYRTICERHLPENYISNPPRQLYQLLYLSPGDWKIPSTNTLTKPIGWDEKLPKKVPIEARHLLFRDFVCDWLTRSLDRLPKDNYRIREYVKQYIEYWN
ncbi:PD-(D/E)XK nuclease family protein [Pedobacter gandavensis]|uniref:PD-(D/E)XK nuclease family protein n=1 Tax=Pedobacter gandavensis TaxID=2679963 RepID=UPI00292F32D7|nr:PD-(D/E)XK nuclease family protein [Pedobacter gandavensis]